MRRPKTAGGFGEPPAIIEPPYAKTFFCFAIPSKLMADVIVTICFFKIMYFLQLYAQASDIFACIPSEADLFPCTSGVPSARKRCAQNTGRVGPTRLVLPAYFAIFTFRAGMITQRSVPLSIPKAPAFSLNRDFLANLEST